MTAATLARPWRVEIGPLQRTVLEWWALSRLVTLLAFAVLEALGPYGFFGPKLFRAPFAVLAAWDGAWYSRIAVHGYMFVPGRQSSVAFFPGYPLVLRAGVRLGIPPSVGGPLVSNLALVGALLLFAELTRELFDDELARRAAIFAAIAPAGFVYSMSYPASLLFLFVAGAALAAMRDRWLLAAVLAVCAGLVRPEAVVLVVPFAALAWSRRNALSGGQRGCALAAIGAAPLASLVYPLYLRWSLGDARAWSQAEEVWGRRFRVGGLSHALSGAPEFLRLHPAFVRDLVLLVVYVVLVGVAARAGTPRSWIVGACVVLVLPLCSGTIESAGRFGLIALPVYWGLAALGRRRRVDLALRALSLAGLVACVLVVPWAWP